MGIKQLLEFIQDGEPVSALTANRTPRDLQDNVLYLFSLIQAAEMGSSLYARSVTVEAEAKVGMPVYRHAGRQRFERGLALLDTSADVLQPAAAAQVWGVVAAKHNDTLADVLLLGYAELDIEDAVDGAVTDGLYYLSGTTAGMLTQQRPPVSVPVLRVAGDHVYVSPPVIDLVDRHVHYRYDLVCRPAGLHTPPAVGERHTIESADGDLPGWLPADHAVFAGRAPTGAVFGYNLKQHAGLREAWPPLPTGNAYLEWDQGLDAAQGFHGVPLGGAGLVVLDRNGIWWMSDCWGDVPWPRDFDSAVSESTSASTNECPRELAMGLRLWFTKHIFSTQDILVRSLRSRSSRLLVTRRDADTEAEAGDLDIRLDLDFTTGTDDDAPGYLVIKSLSGDTALRGPVVSSLVAGGANVRLSGDATVAVGAETGHVGAVTLEVLPEEYLELPVKLVRVDGATEEHYLDLLYLGLPADRESAIRGKIEIPDDLARTAPRLKIRLRLLGRTAGALPQLAVTARRVPRPAGLDVPLDLPGVAAEFAVDITTTATLDGVDQYVEAESEAFEVAAGDQVFFGVTRAGDDGYAGEIGLLKQTGALTSGASDSSS